MSEDSTTGRQPAGRPRVGTRIGGVTLRDDELAAVRAVMDRDGISEPEAVRRIIRDGACLDDAVHGYFVAKARAAMVKAGGNPDLAGPLAAWAQAAKRRGDSRARVVVGEDGLILAEAAYQPGRVGASYVRSVVHDRDAYLVGTELGLAVGGFSRSSGQPTIVVTYSDVCTGPSPRLNTRETK